ncbi:MAG: Ca2+-binding protein toxin-related [Caulobacter sp.]|nr:Ca2+-binding protein toxin-related [Caulobacter sp.]
MPFAAVIELSALDGTDGFRISGVAEGDQSGWSVASAGDVNGDGIDDLIIGARAADPNGSYSGASYVVFGKDTALGGAFAANLNLSALNGTNGFRISGVAADNNSGWSVASAGDVNGDGIDDLIIGAFGADPNGSYSGASYVVFGKDTALGGAFAANLDLSALNGTDGFRISGAAAGDNSGGSVASAGDVNGDGIDDLIVGARRADPNGYGSGASYVVFGKDTALGGAFAANLDLSALNGTDGFRISGVAVDDNSGWSVASAGDVNGDGIDDLIVGAYRANPNGINSSGASYVVFGKDTALGGAFAANLELSALNGTDGFRISGVAADDQSGVSVASAGDVNGDGIGDLIVGARRADPNGDYSGASYVVFGKDTALGGAFAADLNLGALNGTDGFRISGAAAGDNSGGSVASAGDVNGDGIDDLFVGAKYADPNGSYSGASYVVFGKDTALGGAFAADLNLGALNGTDGFRISGVATYDYSGFSVASAGDVNGDGIDDLIVGARNADPNGDNSGASYVIFGRADAVSFTGTGADETQGGGTGADSLSGLGGKDILSGLGGADLIDGGDGNDVLYGGDGADDLIGGAGGDTLNGDTGNDDLDGGEGADKLFGGLGADDLIGGLGNDRLDGGADADSLTGGDGNDYLDGGAGADVMTGGLANDVYLVDDFGDQTVELAGQGYDIVRTALDGWVLGANLEGLELQGALDIDGTGNALANNLQGNGGGNTLSGLAGVDTINGNDGDDVIVGGLGNDLLRGGLGADVFLVAHAFAGALETDIVYDFSAAEGDIIDLAGIDAIAGGADDAFTLVAAFSKTAGQMTLVIEGGNTVLRLDVTGDGKADYQMKINGDVTAESGDWLL